MTTATTTLTRTPWVTFTPDDPHPAWDGFGVYLGAVPDNTATGTSGNIRTVLHKGMTPMDFPESLQLIAMLGGLDARIDLPAQDIIDPNAPAFE